MPNTLLPITPLLSMAREGRYAIGAFNFTNAETLQAVVEEANRQRSPLILIISPWESDLLGPDFVVDMARWMAAKVDVPICLHLDHATDIPSLQRCMEAGFPSVMIDASRFPFEENIRITKTVVEMAKERGVTVEGELGAVGRVDESTIEGDHEASLTDPDDAVDFVAQTGVDALAVAIGNAHGLYKQRPVLDFERLETIAQRVSAPLVLHGGSGTEADQLKRAIELGICKVNVASELARAYLKAIVHKIEETEWKLWYTHALMDGKRDVSAVTARWMQMLGCANRLP